MKLIYYLIFNVIIILTISILMLHNHILRVPVVCFTVSVRYFYYKYAGSTIPPNPRTPLSPHAVFRKVKVIISNLSKVSHFQRFIFYFLNISYFYVICTFKVKFRVDYFRTFKVISKYHLFVTLNLKFNLLFFLIY